MEIVQNQALSNGSAVAPPLRFLPAYLFCSVDLILAEGERSQSKILEAFGRMPVPVV